jgi:hypothetical protein
VTRATRSKQPAVVRDLELERAVLVSIVGTARKRFGVNASHYPRAVRDRLKVGAKRYGDNAFTRRDNIRELLEETADLGGYAVLELQRLAGHAHPEVRDDLLRVALLGAVADFYARRACTRLRESEQR